MTCRQPPALIGAHISIAGGTPLAFGRGLEAGCAAMQIFTKNATRWEATPLAPEEASRFRSEQARTGIAPVVAHPRSYLINPRAAAGSLLRDVRPDGFDGFAPCGRDRQAVKKVQVQGARRSGD